MESLRAGSRERRGSGAGCAILARGMAVSVRQDRVPPRRQARRTLLRILAGLEEADAGRVTVTPPDSRVGYLRQGYVAEDGQPAGAVLYGTRLMAAWQRLGECEGRLAAAGDDAAALDAYGVAL